LRSGEADIAERRTTFRDVLEGSAVPENTGEATEKFGNRVRI